MHNVRSNRRRTLKSSRQRSISSALRHCLLPALHLVTDHAPSLTEQLRELVQTAQQNERTLRRFQDVELALIGARDLASFLDVLFVRLPADFRLDAVRLWVDAALPLLDDLLGGAAPAEPGTPALATATAGLAAAAQLCAAFSASATAWAPQQPWLGAAAAAGERFPALFDAQGTGEALPASAIVLPLVQDGAIIGYLCLGSADAARFSSGMATDILERFALFVAAGLDNVAHRERLKRIGMTDPLTGLANRRYFDERLREEVMQAGRQGASVSCLFIDIDHFKSINDTHGHAAGDRALSELARCVRGALRAGDTLARYGGEEFAALLPRTDLGPARAVAERMRRAVVALDVRNDDGMPIALTVSIGIAVQPGARAGGEALAAAVVRALVDGADRAMYRAKRNGRNRVETVEA